MSHLRSAHMTRSPGILWILLSVILLLLSPFAVAANFNIAKPGSGVITINPSGIPAALSAPVDANPQIPITSHIDTKTHSYGRNKSDDEQADDVTLPVPVDEIEQRKGSSRLVMTQSAEDDKAGYFDSTNLSFSFQEGAKIPGDFDPSKKAIMTTNVKRMIKMEFLLNNKTITIQIVPDGQEFYFKGVDSVTQQVISLSVEEKILLKKVLHDNPTLPTELSEDHKFYFFSALSLMIEWPEEVPLFHWSDENEVTAAISSDKAITIPRNQAKLYNREAEVTIPFDSNISDKKLPSFNKEIKVKGMRSDRLLQTDRGISLCPYIGTERGGSYTVTLLDGNCKQWDFWNCPPPIQTVRFTHLVGGTDCWGRCGGECNGLPWVNDPYTYSQSCHDHDHCVTHYGVAASSCTAIFTTYNTQDTFDTALRCDKPPYRYDFVITSMSVSPRTVTAGNSISIDLNYETKSIKPVGPFSSFIKYYLSSDGSPTNLIATCDMQQVGIWGSGSCTGPVVIPPNLAGNYYLVATIADFMLHQDRHNENNTWNAGQITVNPNVPPIPDLIVTSVTGPSSGAAGSGMKNVSVTVKNIGGAVARNPNNANGVFPVSILLSTNNVISLSDFSTRIDCPFPALAPGQSLTCTASNLDVPIPSNLPSGSYYLGAYVDPLNEITEVSESNNGGAATTAIAITGSKPDLIVTAATGPSNGVVGGGMAGVSFTVKNQGGSRAYSGNTPNGQFASGIFLSTDSNITLDDIQTRIDCQYPALDPGQSYNCVVPFDVPIPSDINPGIYYLGTYADPFSLIDESNESNNGGGIVAINITGPAKPDLVVTSVIGPSRGVAGQGMTGITVTVKNQGAGTAHNPNNTNGQFPAGIVLSKDRSLYDYYPTRIDCQYPSLGPGQSFICVVPFDVSVPTDILAGTYYLGALVDWENSIGEAEETNNWGFSTQPITIVGSQGASAAVGVFRNGQWFLDANGNGAWDGCGTEFCFTGFGQAGDMPASGNWDGGGKSYIGVLRSGTGTWFTDRNGNRQWDGCAVDGCYSGFGAAGDLPVAGDWSGTGFAKIGVFRNGQWYLDNGNGQWDGCGTELCLSFGQTGDLPAAGNWDGGLKAGAGVFRAGTWYLDYNGNGLWDGCDVDRCYVGSFGQAGDFPAAGDWNGDGKAKVGVFRAGTWYLDYNGNGAWDGCSVDRCYAGSFGQQGDWPVAGKW